MQRGREGAKLSYSLKSLSAAGYSEPSSASGPQPSTERDRPPSFKEIYPALLVRRTMGRISQSRAVLRNSAEVSPEDSNVFFFYLFLNNKALFLAADSMYAQNYR